MADPAFDWSPPRAKSRGEDAVKLAALAGLHLDPWQRLAVDRILGETDDDRPAAFEAAIIVPRQNGKGSVLEALSLYWLFVERVPLVLHSAHEFKTAAEAFRRLRTLLQNCAPLWAEVDRCLTGAGSEAIELRGGQRLRYVARSKGSGRGFTASKVILDEAYALDGEEMAALLPTLATQPAAQVVYTSSAGMASSTQLRMLRDRGRAGGDPSLTYLEWGGVGRCASGDGCVHGLDDQGCALNDRTLWAAANPRVGLDFIAKERRALPAAEFGRERAGWWDEGDDALIGGLSGWEAAGDPAGSWDGPFTLAFDVAMGSRSASVAVAGGRGDDRIQLELLRSAPGVGWLPGYLAAAAGQHGGAARVVANDYPTCRALEPELVDAGVRVEFLGAAEFAASCGWLQQALADDKVRHLGDPVLSQAVANAAVANVGDGAWRWARRTSGSDISAIVAATLAGHAMAAERPVEVWGFFE